MDCETIVLSQAVVNLPLQCLEADLPSLLLLLECPWVQVMCTLTRKTTFVLEPLTSSSSLCEEYTDMVAAIFRNRSCKDKTVVGSCSTLKAKL